MPLPNPTTKIIQTGAFCNAIAYQNGIGKTVGLVTNFSYTEDFNITEAQVIGFFGPVSLDAQNYRCNITFGAFVPPKPRAEISEAYLDGGETTLAKLLKTRSEIALTGLGTVLDQVDIVDKQAGTVLNSFTYVVISNNGVTVNPATYVTSNMQMMAIERSI
jgi:hypothetical protein